MTLYGVDGNIHLSTGRCGYVDEDGERCVAPARYRIVWAGDESRRSEACLEHGRLAEQAIRDGEMAEPATLVSLEEG